MPNIYGCQLTREKIDLASSCASKSYTSCRNKKCRDFHNAKRTIIRNELPHMMEPLLRMQLQWQTCLMASWKDGNPFTKASQKNSEVTILLWIEKKRVGRSTKSRLQTMEQRRNAIPSRSWSNSIMINDEECPDVLPFSHPSLSRSPVPFMALESDFTAKSLCC